MRRPPRAAPRRRDQSNQTRIRLSGWARGCSSTRMIAARCLGSNRIRLDAAGSRRFERATRVLVAIDRTEIPRLSSIRSVLTETGTVAARAAREAIGRHRLHQDQNSRTELYLLGALASMRARRVGASREAYPVPEAVIFDLDGVPLDSEQLKNRAKQQLTRCSGGGWHEDAPTVMLGMSSPEWARYLHDELAVPLDPREINRQVVRRMQELYREQLPLLPRSARRCSRVATALAAGACLLVKPRDHRAVPEAGRARRHVRCHRLLRRGGPGQAGARRVSRRSREDRRRSCEVSRSRGLQQRCASRYRGGHDVIAVPNPHYPPTGNALKLPAATVDAIADFTPEAGRTRRGLTCQRRETRRRVRFPCRHQGREPALWLASPHRCVAVAGTTAPCPHSDARSSRHGMVLTRFG